MTLAAYNGHADLTFSDYVDLATGQTLHAEPGGVYDVAPASGRPVPDLPEPWFTLAPPRSRRFAASVVTASAGLAGEGAAAEGDAAPGSEEEADEDPETDTPREF